MVPMVLASKSMIVRCGRGERLWELEGGKQYRLALLLLCQKSDGLRGKRFITLRAKQVMSIPSRED